jgi:hypothetical protein
MAVFWVDNDESSSPWWWRQQVHLTRQYTSTKLHSAATKKTAIFVLTTVRTSDPTRAGDVSKMTK